MTFVGEPLANSFEVLSELFLFGDRLLVGDLTFVSTERTKLRARINGDGSELRVKVSSRSNYDIDTDDVEGFDFNGRLRSDVRTGNCAPPDLAPIPNDSFAEPFCVRDATSGDLLVTIANPGGSAAGTSTTRVDFGAFGVQSFPTMALEPNPIGVSSSATSSETLAVPLDPACFDPSCEFTIEADALDEVEESNDANNVGVGVCR